MGGWKTKTAAMLSVAYGVIGVVCGLHDVSTGAQFVVQGLGLLGIGHKIEKTASIGNGQFVEGMDRRM